MNRRLIAADLYFWNRIWKPAWGSFCAALSPLVLTVSLLLLVASGPFPRLDDAAYYTLLGGVVLFIGGLALCFVAIVLGADRVLEGRRLQTVERERLRDEP